MKTSINNTLLRQLEIKNEAYDVRDIKLKGFILRVLPSSRMVYRCEYARGKRITIGDTALFTPAQARDKAKEILGQSANGADPGEKKKNKKLTLSEYVQKEYMEWRETNRKDAKQDLRRLKVNFFNELSNMILSDISILALEKWRSKRLKAGIGAATINRDIATLKTALSKAEEWGLIAINPLAKLKPLKIDDLPPARYLQKEEEKRLRQALDDREKGLIAARESANDWRSVRNYQLLPILKVYYLRAMVLLTINTGLRRKDLFTLSQDCIDLDNRTITIIGGKGKTKRTRHIPLNSEALAVVKAWLEQISIIKKWWQQSSNVNPVTKEKFLNTELVFFNDRGEQLTDIKKSWQQILRRANINNFRFHDLRHHFASVLVMKGAYLNTVRDLMGHADIKMTLRYAHLAHEHKASMVERLVESYIE